LDESISSVGFYGGLLALEGLLSTVIRLWCLFSRQLNRREPAFRFFIDGRAVVFNLAVSNFFTF
jgi:hypothetical protein